MGLIALMSYIFQVVFLGISCLDMIFLSKQSCLKGQGNLIVPVTVLNLEKLIYLYIRMSELQLYKLWYYTCES